MARSSYTSARVVRQRYFWPQGQLNIWNFVMLAAGATILGVSAAFLMIQQQMRLGVPWIFPFGITVGALTLFFIIIEFALVAQNRLLPGVMMLGAFILLVLFLTGLIETAIQLFGAGNVSENCQRYVNKNKIYGVSASTLAWLEQNSICSSWYAAFSFWIVGTIFFVWMMVMSSQVGRGTYDVAVLR
ncbi:hypothetical protein EG328_001569 [Venturia inaequalis]|uniref:Uncharacterized protein n=1 Tax=Venturia inaequalis TaxID=5025 RepID=A0A8H3UZY3_VENIN|nr:hypothetical protein EG328_001569 [Venturia inaequalis]RDI77478.1 hypothetical protein Vi05172_g12575 [Venturia inaequalis]